MSHTTGERVREQWATSGTGARAGATPLEVAQFEARYELSLPPSVGRFYSTVNGMEEGGLDEEVFAAFPLKDLRPVPEAIGDYRGSPDYGPIVYLLPDAGDYFVFGEGMLWSHVVAVRLRPTGETPVFWISGSTFVRVARTFDEFWDRYLEDPEAVVSATSKLLEAAV